MNKFSDIRKVQQNPILSDLTSSSDFTSVTNDAALSAISNPTNGMLVKTLHDLSLNIYDSTNSKWTKFNNSFVDPSEFGNWVLVDDRTISNASVDYTISGLDGDVDDRYLFVCEVVGGTSTNIYARPNHDTTSSQRVDRQYGGGSHGGNSPDNNTGKGFVIIEAAADHLFFSEARLNTKTGKYRQLNMIESSYNATTCLSQTQSSIQLNSTTKVTSLDIHSNAIAVTKAAIRIYKQTDIKPVELHSYELVKEYNLNNQTLDDTISQDGDVNDSLYIEAKVSCPTAGNFGVRFNNDSSSSNYQTSSVQAGGYAGKENSSYLILTSGTNNGRVNYSNIHINLKSSQIRTSTTNNLISDSVHNGFVQVLNSIQKNTTDKVTTLTFLTTTAHTGFIRVYKLAKTHLICNNPNLLNGMQQKSIDSNTIEIQPGEIEIAGVVCNQTSKLQLTLSGNLRTGESESSSTYYYLYAIKGTGRALSYKFSASKPTLDRYGNTIDFDTAENEGLYHPVEGTTQRYIGQVYNDSTSNILAFDKCNPNHQEGVWTVLPGSGERVLSHALAKLPDYIQHKCKLNVGDTSYVLPSDYFTSGSQDYGIMPSHAEYVTNTYIRSYFAANGVYFTGGVQRTTGYYKLIVKK